MKSCYRCGTSIADNAITCVSCGAIQPLTPPSTIPPLNVPPIPSVKVGASSTFHILPVVYLGLVALASILYFILVLLFRYAITLPKFIFIGIPNLINLCAVTFLIIQLLKNKRKAPLFFMIWGGVFMAAQLINWQMIWRGWHNIFRANGPLYLWAAVNLIFITLLSIFLFSKKKNFDQ